MREEQITKNILDWLEENDWFIICYDFPQSGTGIMLHQNIAHRVSKNKGGIIPDIIAVKDQIALFFENKDRFYQFDFDKLHEIKTQQNYSESLASLLRNYNIDIIYYGIGIIDKAKEIDKALNHLEKVDFLLSINENKEVKIYHDIANIFTIQD
ncbi:MAG: hypothetical protein COZ18_09285 [Flexibacter sp. CG_4_10_14_3_um_filter_32_15]|nr:MAG: hypothetical protein COZ18_09285 [Flexibacter sp. CG_4_10_14_3_um_filter_32_15]